ncbi:hypothetical protein [Alkalilimnicola sp. S0819]|uniref:hypothetical protein n=1 Tax=Alkalilimnicola sp. S0819 TaxID=2613922 RepID=UPI0012617316|nr:hypothetical protein [Alkalilimnicola sp. S0819]KAB7623022.1 hypothetical protein F3N43_10850 [Alkalilimnicola sp. S0819]MPQ17134.1 hypothetical protein [Alkalilimnicola sp. S0819]
MPPERSLLLRTVALNLLVGYITLRGVVDASAALLILTLGTGLALGFVLLALYLRDRLPRFVQTATALFGADLILSIAALPLNIAGAQGAGAWILLGILGWYLAVSAHIFRNALDFHRPAAWAVALAYFFINSLIFL